MSGENPATVRRPAWEGDWGREEGEGGREEGEGGREEGKREQERV